MAGSAQLWPGPRMRAFLRNILAAEPGVDPALAERLADRLTKRIARMLVWDATGATETSATDTAPTTAIASTTVPPENTVQHVDKDSIDFDPFAFSVVVVLKRSGRAALKQRLDEVSRLDQLHRIAVAQHLGIDKSLSSLDAVREAIIAGAEQRLADRRAAAS